jgi:hypothetical protein
VEVNEKCDDAGAPGATSRRRQLTAPVGALELIRVDRTIGVQPAAARALAQFRSPLTVEIARWQLSVLEQYVAPVRSMIDQTRSLTRWWVQQSMALRSLAVPLVSMPQMWWTDLADRRPDDLGDAAARRAAAATARPVADAGHILSATKWVQLNAEVWRDLRHVGRRIAYWAVTSACAALQPAACSTDPLDLDLIPSSEGLREARGELSLTSKRPVS